MPAFLATLVEKHDPVFVVLAGLVCVLACYTAVSLAVRPRGPARSRTALLIAAAVATGCGAWATHLIAVLAFRPGLAVAYDPGLSMLSGAIAVIGSGIGFAIARRLDRMALGGAVVGLAFAGMVYVGLAAVEFPAVKIWDPILIAASLVLGGSFAAASRPRVELTPDLKGRLISTLLLSAGVLSIHFGAIAAMSLDPRPELVVPPYTAGALWFAIAITATLLLIVGLGLVGTLIDRHVTEIEATKRELESALRRADASNASTSMFLANHEP